MIIRLGRTIDYRIRINKYKNNLKEYDFLLKASNTLAKQGVVVDTGVVEYVLCPLLFSFTVWVLRKAEFDGLKRLYFLARDGYPVYRMAKKLSQIYAPDIECKYFFCSRYSLRVPMYSENIEEALNHVCRGGIDVTFRKIMMRSGFSTSTLREMEMEFPKTDFDEIIPYSVLKQTRSMLEKSQVYLEALSTNSGEKWKALKAYFEQEEMISSGEIGIVDSGWTGTTQKSICDILSRCGCNNKIHGYYFGLFDHPDNCKGSNYSSFYFDILSRLPNKVMFSNCLFETIFSAEHGTTCGYEVAENVKPILEQYSKNEKRTHIMRQFERYGAIISRHISSKKPMEKKDFVCPKGICSSMRTFMWNPTASEAEFFGTMMFSDDLLDQTTKEIAPVLSEASLRENHLFNRIKHVYGFSKKQIHESAWFEGSAIRSGKHSFRHKISNSAYKSLSYLKKGISRKV